MKKRLLLIIPFVFILLLLVAVCGNKVSINPRIIVLDENGEEIVYLNNLNKTSTVDIEDLQDKYIEYILWIEDKDFYKHSGFSIPRILKSILNNLFHSQKQGGSTITQQYVKNTYLSNKKSIGRKLKEIYLSIKLENNMTKDEILSEYLSALYFGNNVYGLSNAARYYFDKNIEELTDQEMISFIALWNAPTVYSNHLDKWNQKKNALADILLKKGILDRQTYQSVIWDIKLNLNPDFLNSNRSYFIDQVISEFKKLTIRANFNEVIRIKTYYNPTTEDVASELDTDYALLSLNRQGYFTACIGDRNYTESSYNIAINGKRDIGSTIKPLLYYEAIKCGLGDSVFQSELYSFSYRKEIITVSNSSNHYFNSIDMRTALAVSDNIYATKMHLKLGMNTLVNHLKKYNIEAKPYPSLALGSVGLSLKQLISIYFQFFSEGKYVYPKFIYEIEVNGKVFQTKAEIIQMGDKKICNQLKEMMASVFDTSIPYATCNSIAAKLNTKCYGKSGLTDYDSYMIGFDENHLVAVWSGDIENDELLNPEYKRLPKELFWKTINRLNE